MKNNKGKIIILCILSILLVINTILVMFNVTDSFDIMARNNMFSFLLASETADKFFSTVTFLACTPFMIGLSTVIVLYIFFVKKNKKISISIASMILGSTLLNNVIKFIVQRPRPEYMPVGLEDTFSYPSGHTMAATTLYGLFIYMIIKSNIPKKYKWFYSILLGLLIISIALSRIYLGAHFVTDVTGGVLSSLILLTIYAIIDTNKGLTK